MQRPAKDTSANRPPIWTANSGTGSLMLLIAFTLAPLAYIEPPRALLLTSMKDVNESKNIENDTTSINAGMSWQRDKCFPIPINGCYD